MYFWRSIQPTLGRPWQRLRWRLNLCDLRSSFPCLHFLLMSLRCPFGDDDGGACCARGFFRWRHLGPLCWQDLSWRQDESVSVDAADKPRMPLTPLTNQGCLGNSSCSISLVSPCLHGEPLSPYGELLGDDKDGPVGAAAAEPTASVTFWQIEDAIGDNGGSWLSTELSATSVLVCLLRSQPLLTLCYLVFFDSCLTLCVFSLYFQMIEWLWTSLSMHLSAPPHDWAITSSLWVVVTSLSLHLGAPIMVTQDLRCAVTASRCSRNGYSRLALCWHLLRLELSPSTWSCPSFIAALVSKSSLRTRFLLVSSVASTQASRPTCIVHVTVPSHRQCALCQVRWIPHNLGSSVTSTQESRPTRIVNVKVSSHWQCAICHVRWIPHNPECWVTKDAWNSGCSISWLTLVLMSSFLMMPKMILSLSPTCVSLLGYFGLLICVSIRRVSLMRMWTSHP